MFYLLLIGILIKLNLILPEEIPLLVATQNISNENSSFIR